MPFRFRRRLRFGPFALNLSKNGMSSLSIGKAPFTVNIPLARGGNTRTTVGIPGTGMSWTEEAGGQSRQPSADLPDNEIHTGPRGGHWQWRQSRDGDFYKDYLSPEEVRSFEQQEQSEPLEEFPSTQQIVEDVMAVLVGFNKPGDSLWRGGLVQSILDLEDAPRSVREAALLVKSPEMCELHIRRANGPVATAKAAGEITEAVQTVINFGLEQGWVKVANS